MRKKYRINSLNDQVIFILSLLLFIANTKYKNKIIYQSKSKSILKILKKKKMIVKKNYVSACAHVPVNVQNNDPTRIICV